MSRSFARVQRAWGQGTFPWFELPFDPSAAVSGGGARWRPAPRGEGERKGEMQKPRNGFAALTTLRAPSLRLRFATPLSRLTWRPNEKHRGSLVLNVVGRQGLEPWTNGLRVQSVRWSLTSWQKKQNEEEIKGPPNALSSFCRCRPARLIESVCVANPASRSKPFKRRKPRNGQDCPSSFSDGLCGPWQPRAGAIRPQGKQKSRQRRQTSSSHIASAFCGASAAIQAAQTPKTEQTGHGCPSSTSEGR